VPPELRRKFCHHIRWGSDLVHFSIDAKSFQYQREETIDDVVLEVQQPVGTPGAGLVDLRAQAQQRLDARQRADAHAEIDHYQVGKGAEVYRA
jgi:hypothetical protein